jgi:hypothetical protein
MACAAGQKNRLQDEEENGRPDPKQSFSRNHGLTSLIGSVGF